MNYRKLSNFISIFLFIILLTVLIILINTYGINALKELAEGLGFWSYLAIFALRCISIVIPALPSTAYSILAGGLLGFEKAFVLISITDLLSCSFSFWISRTYGKALIKKIIGRKSLNRIESIAASHLENNFFLMTGFLMTGLFDFVSYAIGLTRTPWKKFLFPLVISILLSTGPVVALGAGVFEGSTKIMFASLIGVFLLAIISSKINRKLQMNQDSYR